MADVDKDVQKMFDEIRHPENNNKWIYESAIRNKYKIWFIS